MPKYTLSVTVFGEVAFQVEADSAREAMRGWSAGDYAELESAAMADNDYWDYGTYTITGNDGTDAQASHIEDLLPEEDTCDFCDREVDEIYEIDGFAYCSKCFVSELGGVITTSSKEN